MVELLHAETTRRILAAYFEVYRQFGYGFLEVVYRRALAVALAEQALPVAQEVSFDLSYLGQPVGVYRADLVVADAVLVECKAVDILISSHTAQVLNYLRASNLRVGLLLNFGPRPLFKRLVLSSTPGRPRSSASLRVLRGP